MTLSGRATYLLFMIQNLYKKNKKVNERVCNPPCGQMKKISHGTFGSTPVSEQQRAYPSPNPPLTLICYKLTVVRLREG